MVCAVALALGNVLVLVAALYSSADHSIRDETGM